MQCSKFITGCRREEARYKWQKNQLARFDARIEKGIAANGRTKLEDCITRKKSAQKRGRSDGTFGVVPASLS